MKMLRWVLCIFLLVQPAGVAAALEVTMKDNGGVFKLKPNDQVSITLPGNPTTGYRWELAAISVDILEPGGEPEYLADSSLPGSGGSFRFHFTARKQGSTRIILAYRRSWETDVAPLKMFEMTVGVNPVTGIKQAVTTVSYVSVKGEVLTASFDTNSNHVHVTLPDNQAISLPISISGSGARYSNAFETFWEHQGKATYSKGGKVIFEGTAKTP